MGINTTLFTLVYLINVQHNLFFFENFRQYSNFEIIQYWFLNFIQPTWEKMSECLVSLLTLIHIRSELFTSIKPKNHFKIHPWLISFKTLEYIPSWLIVVTNIFIYEHLDLGLCIRLIQLRWKLEGTNPQLHHFQLK